MSLLSLFALFLAVSPAAAVERAAAARMDGQDEWILDLMEEAPEEALDPQWRTDSGIKAYYPLGRTLTPRRGPYPDAEHVAAEMRQLYTQAYMDAACDIPRVISFDLAGVSGPLKVEAGGAYFCLEDRVAVVVSGSGFGPGSFFELSDGFRIGLFNFTLAGEGDLGVAVAMTFLPVQALRGAAEVEGRVIYQAAEAEGVPRTPSASPTLSFPVR